MTRKMTEEIKNNDIKDEIGANNTATLDNNIEEQKRDVNIEEAIEAILFAAGHPVHYSSLSRVFNMTPSRIKDVVFEYSLKYNDSAISRGVILLTYSDSCQLCTKQHYLPEIREALGIKKSGTLSTSSMEALAIVAYNQPVTRLFVDTLRRADSSYAMNNLIDRGLIECKGRLDVPGRPMLYGTTSDFLRAFGLKDLDSLPETTEELLAVFENAKSETELGKANPDQNEGLVNEATASQETFDNIIDTQLEIINDSHEHEASAEDDIIEDI